MHQQERIDVHRFAEYTTLRGCDLRIVMLRPASGKKTQRIKLGQSLPWGYLNIAGMKS